MQPAPGRSLAAVHRGRSASWISPRHSRPSPPVAHDHLRKRFGQSLTSFFWRCGATLPFSCVDFPGAELACPCHRLAPSISRRSRAARGSARAARIAASADAASTPWFSEFLFQKTASPPAHDSARQSTLKGGGPRYGIRYGLAKKGEKTQEIQGAS